MPDNKIIGLDLATKTGWAIFKDGNLFESGVQDFSKKRGESNGMMFIRFRNWLNSVLAIPGISCVVYEQAHHRGGAATEIAVNLAGRVQEICAEKGIEYGTVHTGTLKKWATGSGTADKGQMMVRSIAYLGRQPVSDDEADAVLIAAYGWEEYGETKK